MAKTGTYNWRLDPELKQQLEAAARAEKTTVGKLLDRVMGNWLGARQPNPDAATPEQRRAKLQALIRDISSDHDGPLDPYSKDELRKRVTARAGRALRRAESD